MIGFDIFWVSIFILSFVSVESVLQSRWYCNSKISKEKKQREAHHNISLQ
jgi:hypothetical protein